MPFIEAFEAKFILKILKKDLVLPIPDKVRAGIVKKIEDGDAVWDEREACEHKIQEFKGTMHKCSKCGLINDFEWVAKHRRT